MHYNKDEKKKKKITMADKYGEIMFINNIYTINSIISIKKYINKITIKN